MSSADLQDSTQPQSATAQQSSAEARAHALIELKELIRWQHKLLPFTTRFLVVIVVGYFLFSMFEFYEMRGLLQGDETAKVRSEIESMVLHSGKNASSSPDSANVVWKSLLLMETDGMEKRYRTASALLISRIWTKQLAFVTGMVLAFIGAVFILSKLSEARTDVSVAVQDWKASLSSASPGLVLAFFGTTLMSISLLYQPKIEVQDRPIYFSQMGIVSAATAAQKQATESQDGKLGRPEDLFKPDSAEPGK